MAEVMTDVSGSNGELKKDNDEIRVNGDACANVCNQEDEPSSEDLHKDPCIKKILSEANCVEKLYELTEKSPAAIANGHFKLDQTDNKVICDSNSDSSNQKKISDESKTVPPSSVPEHSNNADCDNASDSTPNKDGSSATENEVLNLKTNNASDKEVYSACNPKTDDKKTDYRPEDGSGKSGSDSGEYESRADEDATSLGNTPDKLNKKNKKPVPALNVTPRRSSRNLNKQKNYSDKDGELIDDDTETTIPKKKSNDDDEIQEVTPTDPLADADPKLRMRNTNKTIVVSDTKGLVEFASNAKASRSNKKEPTLVIIDTNSILSGRGPVPVSQSSGTTMLHSAGSAPIPVSLPITAGALTNATRGVPASTSAFSVIPIGLPAQGMYSQFKGPPPQMKPIVVGPASTTVTPITIATSSVSVTNVSSLNSSGIAANKQPPVILPSLTDDMFVVEAPSFIVPYVYEKPPMKSLKEHIEKLDVEIKEVEERERKVRKEKEREEKEKTEKERIEKERVKLEEKQKEEEERLKTSEEADKKESKIAEKVKETAEKSVDGVEKMEVEVEEKESDLQMEVEEEGDPNAAKITSETDIILESSKKTEDNLAEPEKKGEISSEAVPPKEESVPLKEEKKVDDSKKPLSYFDNPLGKFFMQIGLNLVQEHVQTDLLRSQKRKRDKEGDKCSPDVEMAIETLTKTLESSKENNDPFKLHLKKCELCSFKTESILVMAHHLETPHMRNYSYRCNFCPLEVRSPHDILFHMEAEHNIRGRLERAPAFHQCPNCPFEDNQKGKLTRHLVSCSKKYRAERNQEPPLDWEPPAKIPRVTRNRPPSMSPGNAVYQAAMSGLKQVPQNSLLPKLMPNANMKHNMMNVNKRPNTNQNFVNRFPNAATQPNFQQRPITVQNANQGLMYRSTGPNSQTPVLLPQGYQLSGAQIYQQTQSMKQSQQQQQGMATAKLLNQPSISITPLPRQTSSMQPSTSTNATAQNVKPGKPTTTPGSKSSFVVCEICDGYIKDLEQLRNHMQWIHKVKIHPKMIYNRPPLNCQKCQFRFFTDQGLERHLLGSHGLVTSSMQEAANKGKDSGRCPVCGRVYQWKLLNHVARDHQMALKPAHLSYKCTVCTATFGMYKQFESHVYSAHSVVAKRAMDTKKPPLVSAPTSSSQNDSMLKPLKINDEITIIPQPVRAVKPPNKTGSSNSPNVSNKGKDYEEDDTEKRIDDDSNGHNYNVPCYSSGVSDDKDDGICLKECLVENFTDREEYERHMSEKHPRSFKIKLSRLDLSALTPIPDRENAFRLTKCYLPPEELLRRRFKLKNFRINLKNYQFLRPNYVYEVIYHDDIHPEFLVPDTILSEPDDGGTTLPQPLPQSAAPQPQRVPDPPPEVVPTPVVEKQQEEDPMDAVRSFLQQPHFMMGSTRFSSSRQTAAPPIGPRLPRKEPLLRTTMPSSVAGAPSQILTPTAMYLRSLLSSSLDKPQPQQQRPSSQYAPRPVFQARPPFRNPVQKAVRSFRMVTTSTKYTVTRMTTTTTSYRYRLPNPTSFVPRPPFAARSVNSSSRTSTTVVRPSVSNTIRPRVIRNPYFPPVNRSSAPVHNSHSSAPSLQPARTIQPAPRKPPEVIDLLSDSDSDDDDDDIEIVEPENNLNACNNEYILPV